MAKRKTRFIHKSKVQLFHTWMLPALGSAPKDEEEEVRLFCSSVLFQPNVLVKGYIFSLGNSVESKR